MRIVHCFRSPVGGIFRHVRDLAEAQRILKEETDGLSAQLAAAQAEWEQRTLERAKDAPTWTPIKIVDAKSEAVANARS